MTIYVSKREPRKGEKLELESYEVEAVPRAGETVVLMDSELYRVEHVTYQPVTGRLAPILVVKRP